MKCPSDVSARGDDIEDSVVGGDADEVVMAVSGGRTTRRRIIWDDDHRAMQDQLDRYGAGHHATGIYSHHE